MNVFERSEANLDDQASRNPSEREPTDLSESISTSWNLVFRNNTHWGRKSDMEDTYADYIAGLSKATGETFENPFGAVPRVEGGRIASTSEWEGARTRDEQALFDRAVKLAEEFPDLKVMTPEDIRKSVGEKRETRRKERAEAEAGEDFLGGAASMVATMAATITDPPVFGSMAIGAPAAAGILRAALTDAAVGGASEAVAQIGVQRDRQQFGEQADVGEALEAVGLATVGGGIFSAAIRGGVKGTRALVERFRAEVPAEARTSEMRAAEAYLERQHALDDANPFEDTPAGRAEHEARLSEAQASLMEGRPTRLTEAPETPSRVPDVDLRPAARQAVVEALGDDATARAAARAIELGETMKRAVDDLPADHPVSRDPDQAATAPVDRAEAGRIVSAEPFPDTPQGVSAQRAALVAETDELEAAVRARYDATPDARVNVEDANGNVRTVTARELFEELDNDKRLTSELADCVSRTS